MQKGSLSSLTEPITEPIKKLLASSRQDGPLRLVAQGSGYPLLLLLFTVTLHQLPAPSPLHATVLTHPLLPHNQTRSAAHSHTAVHSPPCGHTRVAWLFHCTSLQSQSISLAWGIGVFSLPQLCQQGDKNGKSTDYNNATRERCGCLLPSKG